MCCFVIVDKKEHKKNSFCGLYKLLNCTSDSVSASIYVLLYLFHKIIIYVRLNFNE